MWETLRRAQFWNKQKIDHFRDCFFDEISAPQNIFMGTSETALLHAKGERERGGGGGGFNYLMMCICSFELFGSSIMAIKFVFSAFVDGGEK